MEKYKQYIELSKELDLLEEKKEAIKMRV